LGKNAWSKKGDIASAVGFEPGKVTVQIYLNVRLIAEQEVENEQRAG
jgi:hypothetical protein